ncbi:MAG: hypothetical protein KY475_13950 [Planctomycetes bacterium]|nr:hypothetical protein [Planctomycetota bacterium]
MTEPAFVRGPRAAVLLPAFEDLSQDHISVQPVCCQAVITAATRFGFTS